MILDPRNGEAVDDNGEILTVKKPGKIKRALRRPPKQIMAISVKPGDKINVGGDWVEITGTVPEVISKRTVELCWGESEGIVLYKDDMVNIRLKGFSY